jgi:hypothetical protein
MMPCRLSGPRYRGKAIKTMSAREKLLKAGQVLSQAMLARREGSHI